METLDLQTSTRTNGKLEYVALSRLVASPTNPRKIFDNAALHELAASIKSAGMAQPMLVRPVKGSAASVENNGGKAWYVNVTGADGKAARAETFKDGTADANAAAAQEFAERYNIQHTMLEVVLGGRRFRASQLGKLETVPVIIERLTDAEAMELQIVENLQRADVHPLEEAEGYRALKKAPAIIAQRVGKDLAYIVQRLQLLKLELLAKELFASGHIELAHAITLAKLTPADQLRAVKHLMQWNQLPAKTDWHELLQLTIKDHKNREWRMVRDTPAQLDRWVRDSVLLILKAAPWDLRDAALLPEAGACVDCPKRTGSNAALFASLTPDAETCTDAKCFEAKRKAFISLSLQAAADKGDSLLKLSNVSGHKVIVLGKPLRNGQWVKSKKGGCPGTRRGIFIDEPSRYHQGHTAGSTLWVCTDQECRLHKHTVERDDAGNGAVNRAAQEAKDDAAVVVEMAVRRELLTAMTGAVQQEHGFLRQLVWNACQNYATPIVQTLELATFEPIDESVYAEREARDEHAEGILQPYLMAATDEQLHRVAFLGTAFNALSINKWQFLRNKKEEREDAWAVAKLVGVDADAIAQRVETQHKQAAKAAKKGGK